MPRVWHYCASTRAPCSASPPDAAAGLDSKILHVKPLNLSILHWHFTLAAAGEDSALPRVKPFKYTYEKEIVMYAYFKKLDYFSTECVYAPFAARGYARDFIKDLEVGWGTPDAACLRTKADVVLCRQLLLHSCCLPLHDWLWLCGWWCPWAA